MSKTLNQIYIANPITSNTGTDLMYFAQSPYTAGSDAAMTYTNFAAQFAGTSTTATKAGVQAQSYISAAGGGTANAQTVTLSPAPSAYTDRMIVIYTPSVDNNNTTPTINVNGLGNKTIVKWSSLGLQTTVVASDISTNYPAILMYSATSDKFQLLNPANPVLYLATSGTSAFGGGSVPGGIANNINYSFCYGNANTCNGNACAIFGTGNTSNGTYSFISGFSNTIGSSSTYCSIMGGTLNTIGTSCTSSFIIGKSGTISNSCNYAYALGNGATAGFSGSVSWCDSSSTSQNPTTTNQFSLTFSNGYLFNVGSTLAVKIDSNNNLINQKGTADQSYSLQAPTTGFNITIGAGVKSLVLNPAGTLATGTITMPAAPIDGQEIRVSSSQIITALTVSANSGQTIDSAPTTIATAGTGFAYIYNLSGTKWFRLY